MAFKLPPNLTIGGQYRVTLPEQVAVLESRLLRNSRLLVGLVFRERYDGFVDDCERADQELRKQPGLLPWPEYPRFVTPDPDGEAIAWVTYLSSPVWWTWILITLGGIFLLPIIAVLPFWVIEKLLPGITQFLTTLVTLVLIGGMVVFLPRLMAPKERK